MVKFSTDAFKKYDNWLPIFLLILPTIMIIIPVIVETPPEQRIFFTPLLPLIFQALVIIYSVISGALIRPNILPHNPVILAVSCIFLSIVFYSTAMEAVQKYYSILKLIDIFLLIAAAYFSAYLFERSPTLARNTLFAIFGSIILAVPLSALLFAFEMPSYFRWPNFIPGFVYIRIYGFALAVSIAVGIGLLTLPISQNRTVKTLVLLGLTLLWTTLFWTGSRGGVVAIICVVPTLAVFIPRLRSILLPALATMIIGGIISIQIPIPSNTFGVINVFNDVILADSADSFGNGRLDLWKGVLQLISEKPWFGNGYAQFIMHARYVEVVGSHTHNIILEAALAWGWIGAACAGFLVIYLWILALKKIWTGDLLERTPAFVAVNVMLVYALVDGAYFYYQSLVPLAFCIGVLSIKQKN